MLIDDKELKSRMESPLNLLNRLRSVTNPHKKANIIPALPPSADEIIDNLDDKISNTTNKNKATNILNSAMDELHRRLPEVQKPEKLALIAEQMSKIVDRTTATKLNNDDRLAPQIIIYAPMIAKEEDFNIIDIGDN